MSLVHDQIQNANDLRKEERRIAEMDHRMEMAKERLKQDNPKDPRVTEFISRRKIIALQLRRRLGEQVLPKRRQLL